MGLRYKEAKATAAAVARRFFSCRSSVVGIICVNLSLIPIIFVTNTEKIKNKSSNKAVIIPIAVKYIPSINIEFSISNTLVPLGFETGKILHYNYP